MAIWNDPQPTQTGFGASSKMNAGFGAQGQLDAGLRRHMLSIYNYMASGVLLSGIVAMVFAQYLMGDMERLKAYAHSPLHLILAFVPLAFVMVMSFGINRIATPTLQLLFWGFSVAMGLSLSSVLIVYTGASVAATFFATAAAFAGLSLVGYTTEKDLSGFGSFLIMGLIGLIFASLINLFLHSSGMQFAISVLGVLIFAGLTAYDTQRLKAMYYQVAGTEWAGKMVIMGALTLYLDFINMFLYLLRFMGDQRR